MCRKKVQSDRQFSNVDYTQLTETDNGFFDSQVCEKQYKNTIQHICIIVYEYLSLNTSR